MSRQAGVLIPLFSLRSPSDWGVGEIPDLVPFARWAARSGFSVIQLLPVNEASRGQNSPYAALSAFAIDPVYMAVDQLEDFGAIGGRGALSPEDRAALETAHAAPSIRWEMVRAVKSRALEASFKHFLEKEWMTRSERARALERYAKEHASWLDEYALFVAIHDDLHRGMSWTEWDHRLRDRDPAALEFARADLEHRRLYRAYLQWQLDLQWHAARRAANDTGVELMGDLPFMVATDSADVWSRPHDFRLDARVGVPPDAFSETGQDWGLPVYRWDVMERNGYEWMNERGRRGADLYGLYRVDHVVGFYRTYYFPNDGAAPAFIPATEPDQVKNGERVMAILSQGARVIAEDLGTVPEFVRLSLTRCGIPGYRVLRWEKHWEQKPNPPFRDPARWPALSVGTTGTHDTETVAEWFDAMAPEERRAFFEMPGMERLRQRAPERFDAEVRDALLEVINRSGSDLVLVPFQDAVGHRERVNVPGTVTDENWTYRLPMDLAALSADLPTAERLRGLAAAGGRATLEQGGR
jgi:4-alpha-glucanotransferase